MRRTAKIAYWNDLLCSLFAPLEVVPAEPSTFDAQARIDSLGSLFIAHIRSQPATVTHNEKQVARTATREFTLTTLVEGRAQMCHYGHEIVLEAGDFVLSDSASPSRLVFETPGEIITVVLPEAALRAHIPVPDRVCGLRMSGRGGSMGSIVSDMLCKLWQQVEVGLPEEFGSAVARNLLDVVATAYAMEYSAVMAETAVTSARLAHIKRYVETNLRNPDLSPGMVAEFFGVSPRYVRMIFAGQNENLSTYILRRRLAECAEQLASVLWRGHTIADIALAWGFTSTAHFTRVFKEQFGVTPREYRRNHLPPKPVRRKAVRAEPANESPGAATAGGTPIAQEPAT